MSLSTGWKGKKVTLPEGLTKATPTPGGISASCSPVLRRCMHQWRRPGEQSKNSTSWDFSNYGSGSAYRQQARRVCGLQRIHEAGGGAEWSGLSNPYDWLIPG